MKERPILFNGDMVRAILAGRKTQTRRIVKPEIVEHIQFMGGSNEACTEFDFVGLRYGQWKDGNGKLRDAEWLIYCTEYPEEGVVPVGQLYGAPGDRLWVRETCRTEELEYAGCEDGVRYLADDHWRVIENTQEAADAWVELNSYRGQKGAVVPSIHMPRWASRILLEIVSVRVERLNDISEDDAIAEGVVLDSDGWRDYEMPSTQCCPTARDSYGTLWQSINGPDSLEANPWVWVIEYKVVKP